MSFASFKTVVSVPWRFVSSVFSGRFSCHKAGLFHLNLSQKAGLRIKVQGPTAGWTLWPLRIAERSSYERKRAEFSLAKNLSERDLPVARPEAFWLDEQFVYSLFEWLEGEDMAVLPSNLSDRQLYALGCQAGQFLRKLHSLPIDQSQRAWNSFYQAKIDSKLAAYQAARHSYEND